MKLGKRILSVTLSGILALATGLTVGAATGVHDNLPIEASSKLGQSQTYASTPTTNKQESKEKTYPYGSPLEPHALTVTPDPIDSSKVEEPTYESPADPTPSTSDVEPTPQPETPEPNTGGEITPEPYTPDPTPYESFAPYEPIPNPVRTGESGYVAYILLFVFGLIAVTVLKRAKEK